MLRASDTHIETMKGKFVFETEEQRQDAVLACNLDILETAVLGDGYRRICRPRDAQDKAPSAYIFWTKDSPEDDEPTDEKVVRIFPCSYKAGAL